MEVPGVTTAELKQTLLPLAEAKTLPTRLYTDERVLTWERERLFASAWQCVGRSDDVAVPGEYFVVPVTPAGVIVTRDDDGCVRALHNVCRHRATTLVSDAGGRCDRFVCPYHGWSYGLDGRLLNAPGMQRHTQFVRSEHGLQSVETDEWNGLLFVRLSSPGPSLDEYLASSPPHMKPDMLHQLSRGRTQRHVARANWKLLVENFVESHHFPLVHPELERLTPWRKSGSSLVGRWLCGHMDLVDGVETVSNTGRLNGRPRLHGVAADDRRVYDAYLWPSLLTSVQPDYLLTYHLFPLAADRTEIVSDIYFHPAALETEANLDEVFEFWDTTNAQDRAICERQQIGVQGTTARGCYAPSEDGMHAFDRWIVEHYLGERDDP